MLTAPIMDKDSMFTHTEPALGPILDELRRREPIFHSLAFGSSTAAYERAMAPNYWEVGASGRRYSRNFILEMLEAVPPPLAESLGWKSWDHAVRQLGSDTYLMTYVLQQGDRLTRRATIWQSTADGWLILYHQGTVVSAGEDETASS